MQENTNTEPIDIYFTQASKFCDLFKIAARDMNFTKTIDTIISDWKLFSQSMPFVYLHPNDTFEVSGYNKEKINNCQFVLIHDYFDGELDIKKTFSFFHHHQTNKTIIARLTQNENFLQNNIDSCHEKETNGVKTPYYEIIEDIINHFKSLDNETK